MIYCTKCILPNTRPNLFLNNKNICNACIAHETKKDINWNNREKQFLKVVKNAKRKSIGYDCLIPVSGGKDSTWQVIKCLEYDLKPLALTWKTPSRTRIGRKNLDNLIKLGVDHIDFQINPKIEKIFLYQSLSKFGSTGIPMHMAIFNLPLRIALNYKIPLIIWGENSAFEYGGTKQEEEGFKLDKNWFNKFGVTHGTTARDWVSEELPSKEMYPYTSPSEEEINKNGILGVFLGYYFLWDPEMTQRIAAQNGFKSREKGSKTGYYNYADIDDNFISIHHYLKWYKFGFTRIFDNLSIEIRNGRKLREEAIQIVKEIGDDTPMQDIINFCSYIGITENNFFSIIEKFRNHNIWKKSNNIWKIKNFLIDDWSWK